MEKGILEKLGNGWRMHFNGKAVTINIDFGLKNVPAADGKEVLFSRDKSGQVDSIEIDGKKLEPIIKGQTRNQHQNQGRQNERRPVPPPEPRRDYARAPYNFVPLNEKVIPADVEEKNLSGFVDLTITAKSDLFIRGKREKFFKAGEKEALPGSSVRGMIRTLVEIATCSKMEMMDGNRNLFFRNIQDNNYKNIFIEQLNNGIVRMRSKPGWILKRGGKYILQKASKVYKVDIRSLEEIGLANRGTKYLFSDIWFDPNSVTLYHEKQIGNRTFRLEYNKIRRISRSPIDGFSKGTLLQTGDIPRKHFQWIIGEALNDESADITNLMATYAKDENRDEGADLIKILKKKGDNVAIPCFYIEEHGQPVAIGHTGLFRYPYKYKIQDAVKQKAGGPGRDMASEMFGYAEDKAQKAGRIFFEDCPICDSKGTELKFFKILSSPKPTSFQLYLEQNGAGNEKIHWGSDIARIRGNKMYWHSKKDYTNPDAVGKNEEELLKRIFSGNEMYTAGNVVKAGSIFKGRIRFEGLSKAELGALLFVLELPKGCAHKIGMGKPLGLGSVEIACSLNLKNLQERYKSVFGGMEWWNDGLNSAETGPYNVAFQNYMREHLGADAGADYWQNERMKELKCLLTLNHQFDGVTWENRVRYMEIQRPNIGNEYRRDGQRLVLPKPTDVIKPGTYTRE
jgi:CRISPR-associated protein (TIGR03986 family)